jgi:hypothetical protein
MTSTVLDRALARKAQLLEELEKVEQFIALYHRFERHEDAEATGLTSERPPLEARDVAGRAVKPREAVRLVLDLLHHHNKPLTTRTIFDLLQESSIRVTGKNPVNNLSAALSYDKRVKSTSSGWVLVKDTIVPEISGAETESKAPQPMRTDEALHNEENPL